MMQLIGISGRLQSGKDLTARIIQYLTSGADKANIKFEQWDGNPVWGTTNNPFHISSWEVKKFATALKQVCSILTGIPVEDFEKQEVKESYLNEEWDTKYYGCVRISDNCPIEDWKGCGNHNCGMLDEIEKRMSVRELLQKLGTDAVRNNVHQNAWVNALMSQYKPLKLSQYNPSKWIISDMRFPNEFDAVKERGGITIRINRPEYEIVSFGEQDIKLPVYNHPSETALDNHTFDYDVDNSGSIEQLVEKVRIILLKENII